MLKVCRSVWYLFFSGICGTGLLCRTAWACILRWLEKGAACVRGLVTTGDAAADENL